MHECTFLFTVIACIVHHGRHAVPAQGVRVQNSTKNGARVHLNGANLLPSLSVFEKPRPHFVAELIRFDRMERGPISLYRDGHALTLSGTKTHLISVNDGRHLVQLGPTTLAGYLSSTEPVSSAGNNEWYLARLNTFQDGGPADGTWSYTSTSSCEGSYDKFLGGHWYGSLATQVINPVQRQASVSWRARVHFFDKWEGESVYVKINGTIVWTKSSNWCPQRAPQVCARRGIDSCGHSYPDRLSVPVEIELSHTGPALLLSFGSTMPKKANPCTASWGIDDVSIYLH